MWILNTVLLQTCGRQAIIMLKRHIINIYILIVYWTSSEKVVYCINYNRPKLSERNRTYAWKNTIIFATLTFHVSVSFNIFDVFRAAACRGVNYEISNAPCLRIKIYGTVFKLANPYIKWPQARVFWLIAPYS